ncbi:rhodanese-related sulfurtransferase [Clostridium sp. YIM B02505]|uniref:tRNA uridine(34) hydroxylase n=1 Tax=Clostridium yunnanense TaxID=2800325 RepID=A0ABS1ENC0_9CLOT|nr:rhodanese-related sulfurtransferase [Clostridium yunnanense]MBK1810870.1 rhodanese-related sulfurtransferase [Clostridium yunnanense]
MNKYRILLYYKFINIENSKEFSKEHLKLCKDIGLKGRILIADEGINGTVSGTVEQTEKYINELKRDYRFVDMIFKIDEANEHAFKKMYVRHKNSIITLLPEDDVDPNERVGRYLKPKEFYQMLQRDDVIIVDGRNDYEYNIGHFRGAIKPNVSNFKEFPKWIDDNLSEYKNKKILTYCTGGIRCEKLTGVLLDHGFDDVYHLEGGIVTYGKDTEVRGKLWDGKCYVFDERVSVRINNTDEDIVISKCTHCGEASDRYINCTNDDCHKQHICCEKCEKEQEGFCSNNCRQHILEHPDRDARLRLKEKVKMYKRYNQYHEKAKEAIGRVDKSYSN